MNKYTLKLIHPIAILKKHYSENLELKFTSCTSLTEEKYGIFELTHTAYKSCLVIFPLEHPSEKLVVEEYTVSFYDHSPPKNIRYEIPVQYIKAYCSEQTLQWFEEDFRLTVGIEDVVEQHYKRAGFFVRHNSSLTGPSNWSGQVEKSEPAREDNLFIYNEDFMNQEYTGRFNCNSIQKLIRYDHVLVEKFTVLEGQITNSVDLQLINGDILTLESVKCGPTYGLIINDSSCVTYKTNSINHKTPLQQEFSKLDFMSMLAKEWGIEFDGSVMRTWS